jgi:AraC-like DNA-binding protein
MGPILVIVAQGAKRTVLGNRRFEYADGQYFIVSVELPMTGSVTRANRTRPFLTFGLILQPVVIASLLLQAPAIRFASGDVSSAAVSDMQDDLLDASVRLLRLLDSPEDAPILRDMIECEIHWRLLNSPQGAMVRQIGLANSRLSQIGRATHWIRTRYAEILCIEDLAQLSGMSVSSFHRHFRAVTTMTPLQYQKQIRLQEARARLISDAGDVAAVGFAVGYESPSQFNREYRRQFGNSPGRDAARLKTVSVLDHSLAELPIVHPEKRAGTG